MELLESDSARPRHWNLWKCWKEWKPQEDCLKQHNYSERFGRLVKSPASKKSVAQRGFRQFKSGLRNDATKGAALSDSSTLRRYG
jgi:hypothetical protein